MRVARPRRAKTTTEPITTASPGVTLTRKHRTIVALTRQILELDAGIAAQDAHGRMAIGGLLLEVRERLDHGDWEDWLAKEVPYGPRTALRYMTLHRWSQDHPGLANALADLGPTKLYQLARLDDRRLKRLTKKKRHRVSPSTTLTLHQMSVEQLRALIARTAAALDDAEARRRAIQGMARKTHSSCMA